MISVEIKARCADPVRVHAILKSRRATFKGLDHQRDTYFCVPAGRLKLRQGNIENALIYYKRADQKNSKRCDSVLYKDPNGPALKKILALALGLLTVVEKKRAIYFIQNVKFHIDKVKGLGNFVEIEAFGKKSDIARLRKQCEDYQGLLGILPKDLAAGSYSDQLLGLKRM